MDDRIMLDVKPIPEQVLYLNQPQLADRTALDCGIYGEGKLVDPAEDNIRVYVPLDINADAILRRLDALYRTHGYPTERNESELSCGVDRLLEQLDIYDRVWSVRESNGEHSAKGKRLAGEIIQILQQHEGIAECFPYDAIEELQTAYGRF